MKNIILAITLCLPFILNGQDKNYPYSMSNWVIDNNETFQGLPPLEIDINDCNLNNPVYMQNSSDMDGIFNDVMCAQCNQPQIVADNFMLDSDQQVGSICWVGYFFSAMTDCTPGSVPTFTIKYFNSIGGLPGAQIASFDLVPTALPTGNIIEGADQTIFTTEHAPVDFSGGVEYWVSIYTSIPDGAAPCDYAWDLSNQGDVFSSVSSTFPTFNWVGSGSDYTFFLGSTTLIPTLSEWGIIILSLLLMIIGVVSVKVPSRRLNSI